MRSGAPQQTTAHSRAVGHAARQEQARQHTPAENNSRQPDPATNSRQPQATTHSTGRHERNNEAPPARHDTDRTTPYDKRPPGQSSTAPQERTQPRAATGDQATATGGSSTGKEPSPTQACHTAPGETQNTPRGCRKTGNNTHRTGTTREQPTTQHKRKTAPAGAQGRQNHTPAHPTAQDTQTSPNTAGPAHQGKQKNKKKGQQTNKKQEGKKKSRGGGEGKGQKKTGKKKQQKGGGGREEHETPRPRPPRPGKHGTTETMGAQQGVKKKENKKTGPNHKQGNSSLEGAEQTKSAQRADTGEGEAHQNAPGWPARPTRLRGARIHTRGGPERGALRPKEGGVGVRTKQPRCTCRVPCRKTDGTGNPTRQ